MNSEAEFLHIAESLKPFTEDRMKLEPFPWVQGYLINMDELYTELTLETLNNTRFGVTGKTLRNYVDMFEENSESGSEHVFEENSESGSEYMFEEDSESGSEDILEIDSESGSEHMFEEDSESGSEHVFEENSESGSEYMFEEDSESGSEDILEIDSESGSEHMFEEDSESGSEHVFEENSESGSEYMFEEDSESGSEDILEIDSESGSEHMFEEDSESGSEHVFEEDSESGSEHIFKENSESGSEYMFKEYSESGSEDMFKKGSWSGSEAEKPKKQKKRKKILAKGDAGMGKSTLGKKIGLDWARGLFKMFSIIFFIVLRIVKPGDCIEDVIIQQIPELEGLNVSKEKIRKILDRFGDKCLLILDGLDEHGLGQNQDVLKIIQNRKLLNCGVSITSRPHSTREIQSLFPTVVRVDGFTTKEAKKYVLKFFTEKNKITQTLGFKPSDSREDFPVHKCPILLSFLCLLVKEEEIDLLDSSLTVGDLYLRMVRCLYRKYTNRKGIGFVESEFVQVMKSVGKLALQTLITNNPLLQRSEVEGIVGVNAFEYGFFTGHEDFRLCTDPTADICVTYAHRSLEEFFGSFGFLQALDDGQSIDDILGSDCKKPIFMVNPLVLRFCLWLLTTKFFNFPEMIFNKLVLFAAERIDFRLLNIKVVEEMYPAMGFSDALLHTDSLKLKFLKHVLEKCQCIRVLRISHQNDIMCNYEQVDGILGLMSSDLLSKLTFLSITGEYLIPSIDADPLAISIHRTDLATFHKYLSILLPKYNLLKRNPKVYASVQYSGSLDLNTLMTKHIKQLNLLRDDRMEHDSHATLFVSGKFPHCPQLTQVILEFIQIDNSVATAFLKAVQNGELPHLKRIELFRCILNDCEWPVVPEFSFGTDKKIDLSQIKKLLSKNVTICTLHGAESHDLQQINNIFKKGRLPNLTELGISSYDNAKLDTFLDEFDPQKTVKLGKLALRRFTISAEGLEVLSEKLSSIRLTQLSLTCLGFTGSLSALFTHSFPTLNTLILSECHLNSNDLQSLVRANVDGKLPQLRHLDISENEDVIICDLFTHSAQWNQLKTLRTSDVSVLNVDPKYLTSLEELILHTESFQGLEIPSVTRRWLRLKVIEVRDNSARCIVDGVEQGMFPSLTTVRYSSIGYYKNPFFFKLLKANISVELV